jgi:hypothetical protein
MTKRKKINSKLASKVDLDMKKRTLKFVVLGEKGGVGKTWFSFILIELIRSIFKTLPVIIDMDTSTPNIAKIYQEDNYATWFNIKVKVPEDSKSDSTEDNKSESNEDNSTENIETNSTENIDDTDENALTNSTENINDTDEEALTKVYSKVAPKSKHVSKLLEEQIFLGGEESAEMGDKLLEIMNRSPQSVTCFPSQSQKGLNKWLDDNGIEQSKTDSDLVFWWVSDGSFESLDLFQKFIEKYPKLECCLVLNRGVNVRIWNKYSLHQINPTLSEKIADKSLKGFFIDSIDIDRTVMIDIQDKGVSFQDIIENNGDKYNKYFVNRFNIWLEKSFNAINKTGYIIDKTNNSSTSTQDTNLPTPTANTNTP